MIVSAPSETSQIDRKSLSADLVVVGGVLDGVCGAIAASREALKVVQIQDSPVLGVKRGVLRPSDVKWCPYRDAVPRLKMSL